LIYLAEVESFLYICRTSIFLVHLKNIKTAVDKEELAKRMASLTPGFSGECIEHFVRHIVEMFSHF